MCQTFFLLPGRHVDILCKAFKQSCWLPVFPAVALCQKVLLQYLNVFTCCFSYTCWNFLRPLIMLKFTCCLLVIQYVETTEGGRWIVVLLGRSHWSCTVAVLRVLFVYALHLLSIKGTEIDRHTQSFLHMVQYIKQNPLCLRINTLGTTRAEWWEENWDWDESPPNTVTITCSAYGTEPSHLLELRTVSVWAWD